jgi:hypothetical protein
MAEAVSSPHTRHQPSFRHHRSSRRRGFEYRRVNRRREKPRTEKNGRADACPHERFFRFRELCFVSLGGEEEKTGPNNEEGCDGDADFYDDSQNSFNEFRKSIEPATEGIVVLRDSGKNRERQKREYSCCDYPPMFHYFTFYPPSACGQGETNLRSSP